MTFLSKFLNDRPLVLPAGSGPRLTVPDGLLSRRELRRIIAEQLD